MDGLNSHDIAALTAWARGHTGLTTPRTWTRPLRVEDAEALYDTIKNPRVHRWVSVFEQPCTLSTLRRWIAVRVARMEAGEGVWSGVFVHGSDVPMGWVSIDLEPELGGVELGGMLGELYWGKGFVEEVSFALMNEVMAAGVSRVIATCAIDNYSSMRVILALNFEKTGQMDRSTPQGPRPSLVFELTPERWRKVRLLPLYDGLPPEEIAQRRRELHALCRELKSARDHLQGSSA
jgi:RimJ/RimL family protein N-acetyltransferase